MSLLEHYKTQIGESIELADSYACSQCRETLPTEQFLIERDGGHITKMPYCQRCFGIIQSTGRKRCKDCGDVKLLSKDFGAHVSSMDGHYHSCTDCMQTANRQRKAVKQQTQSRTYDSVEHRKQQYQHRSGYIPEEEFRRQNDLFRQYGYYWKDYIGHDNRKHLQLHTPQGEPTTREQALEEIAILQQTGKRPRIRLTYEDQIIAKPMFNSHGYYWSDPRRTKDFRLLDRNGNPVWDERKLFYDMKAFPTKYQQEQQEAHLNALQLARDLVSHSDTLILDIETTGVGREYEEIVELAILRLDGTKVFYSLIHADKEISEEATAKSGITNDMLATSPTFPEVWQTVSSLIEGKQVPMFNADFDKRILAEEAEHYQLSVPVYEPVCLMRMFMSIVPGTHHSLQNACEHFGITASNHRATEDAEVTRQLLVKMAQIDV